MSAETKRCTIHTYCKFCKSEGVKRVATLMTKYSPSRGYRDHYKHYSCSDHSHLLEDTDPNRTRRERNIDLRATLKEMKNDSRNNHYTEADYQTCLRL
ncbi:hypothetical protein PQC57_gp053 [Escherichia phage vB_EcoP_WFI101126]|uniref:Uncharacterized protein n=1 Tax=Escherichia phage vB_EcoP_WFI101126 TaxID=2508203 RepID=A0A482MR64_9CAUD|nr:hypothetical protein PQC57_gp053 [Escherichia phage vB_EcoP_WFI101126]QBQ76481.1 hypothetical protein WFI101126_00053 [Escherichia phage vB_EcoP_WFI101126]